MKTANWATGALVSCVLLFSLNAVGAQDWPQWRGPNRDNKVAGFTVPKEWPKELKKGWTTKVGLGDACPVLVGDKIYVFTREGGDEVICCLDAEKGTEVWKNKYPTKPVTGPGSGHGGPRGSPAVADGKVCTFGVAGVISCLDTNGKLLWRKDTKDYPRFFASSSPLILDGKAIVYIGDDRKGEMVAYDLISGDVKWKWDGEGAAYGSPVLMTIDSTKMLVTLTNKSLVGINAADGKLLWKTGYSSRYNSVTPVVDGAMVICSCEGGKTVAFKIEKKDDGFAAKELWSKSIVAGKYNTPMLKDGLLYGLSAGGGGGGGGGRGGSSTLFCLKADTGDTAWTDSTKRGECGGVLDAGSVLLLFSSNEELVVFKPSDKKFEEIAKYKIADSPTWAYPIVAGKRVFVKDKDSVTLWTIE